ncbi:MAG: 4Fe-4S dicluster domain-containing protein [Proteobacteria bacterium]|nr:4Fe-4S dicluster domain-containing protein [Pseudomonadota bacterium]MBU4470613.1 4Fe-4S dicluster domain-containing protein [Pseudomonadota bacterium]MCG2753338.1 4Fe-4S dicluster domain-containing protein [Desulfobacteraceae bacterium]
MFTFVKNEQGAKEALRTFLTRLLEEKRVDCVFVAATTPYSNLPMPALIARPEELKNADPFAPVAPFNAARQAAALLRQTTRKKLAFVLRPCELRAVVELTKLNQAVLEGSILLGMECRGRMEKDLYLEESQKYPDLSLAFYEKEEDDGLICTACKACQQFLPLTCDLVISVFGQDLSKGVGLISRSETGSHLLEALSCPESEMPTAHEAAIAKTMESRKGAKEELLKITSEKIQTLEGFETLIANCLNCYSCRVACPVCYCRECVFLTDVFAHEPSLLIRRAEKKGVIKMPVETTMFHLTRLAHIGHACVACGHCTSVCPSHIPVADFFITVGSKVQGLFDYAPGRDVNEPIPYLVFEDKK